MEAGGYPEVFFEKGQDFLSDIYMELRVVKEPWGVFWELRKKEGIVGKLWRVL